MGFEATRVRDIHAPLEISEQTFFNYFPTKQAVLDELALDWLRENVVAVSRGAERAGDQGTPLIANLSDSMRPILRAIERDRDFMRLVFTRSSLFQPEGAMRDQHADRSSPLHQRTRAAFDALAHAFAAAQKSGELRDDVDPLQLAEVAFGVFRVSVGLWLTNYWDAPGSLEARLESAFELLWNGARPS